MPLFSEYNVQIVKGSDEDQGIGEHGIIYEAPAFDLLPRRRQGDRAVITTSFSWSRVLAAAGVLILIFVAGVYSAHDPAMKDWSTPLLNTFTVLLSGLGGIIIGEKTAGPDITKLLPPAGSPPRPSRQS